MSNAQKSRITLELEAGGDPIRGLIEHPDGTREPFWGWLELMAELRRVAAGKRAPLRQSRRVPGRLASDTREAGRQQPDKNREEQS